MSAKFYRRKVFHDPTPNAIVLNRIVKGLHDVALKSSLADAEKQRFWELLLLTAYKIVSVWKHKERFKTEEQRLVEELKSPKPTDPDSENSQELLDACDVFLVQIKSALDHLVKFLEPVLGKKVSTFGDKGEKVFATLKNNCPRKYKPLIQSFETHTFEKHRLWLETAISARDRVNHCIDGGFSPEAFSVVKVDDKIVVPHVGNGISLASVMDELWLNLILLVEDLGGLFLQFRIEPPLVLLHRNVPRDSPKSAWEVTTEGAIDQEFGRENFKTFDEAMRKPSSS